MQLVCVYFNHCAGVVRAWSVGALRCAYAPYVSPVVAHLKRIDRGGPTVQRGELRQYMAV